MLHQFADLRIQFTQYQSGYLDPGIWRWSTRSQARRWLELWPYVEFEKFETDPEFQSFLDELARESGLPSFSEINSRRK